jgi:hypothetical protein
MPNVLRCTNQCSRTVGNTVSKARDLIAAVDVSGNEEWNGTERRHLGLEGDKLFNRVHGSPEYYNFQARPRSQDRVGAREIADCAHPMNVASPFRSNVASIEFFSGL